MGPARVIGRLVVEGTTLARPVPAFTGLEALGSATDWAAVASGAASTSFVGVRAGALYGWSSAATLAPFVAEAGIAMASLGPSHRCSVLSSGALMCVGTNDAGELGDGTTTARAVPVPVGTDSDWSTVAAGASHTCGIRAGGELYCWGSNESGQLGDGTAWTSSPITTPL